ncbi:hypothetical protein HPB51_023318 [Rhipicephalus microplus]|uniref:Kinesin-like protein n=1 Tax=Rhipicephalus microplus TaxID=6941 RepID=A0A9J6EJN8_RHIMP|nr:hypothetical protein HPB51_023318 [Rhipicephalus microplus]
MRDDPAKVIAISNLSIHKVKESGALFEFLLIGNRNSTQHATHANSESSRSHAIFQVYVTQTENVTSMSKGIRVSKMSFVNLAGSERGNCIDALSKGGAKRVPYRDSKLTHILKDSLGGTGRTLLIAAVSPSKLSYTDTHNTLKYAERAMKIKLQAQKNVINVNAHTLMYSSLIEEYKQKVEGLQRKLDKAENEKSELEIQAVVADIAKLELVVEGTDRQGEQKMFAELAKLLCQKCNYWENLNSVAVPHLRSLYFIRFWPALWIPGHSAWTARWFGMRQLAQTNTPITADICSPPFLSSSRKIDLAQLLCLRCPQVSTLTIN